MIKLTKNYYMDADNYQYILKKKRVVKDSILTKDRNIGRTYYTEEGFYGSMSSLLVGLADYIVKENIKGEEITDMKQSLKEIIDLRERVDTLTEFK